jgi:hypothetical protein
LALPFCVALAANAWALAPPTNVRARDVPNDDGGRGLEVVWSYQSQPEDPPLREFAILRRAADEPTPSAIAAVPKGARSFRDAGAAPPPQGETSLRRRAKTYLYTVRAVYQPRSALPAPDGEPATADSPESLPAAARGNWFHTGRVPILIATTLLGGLLLWFTSKARAGTLPHIRRIPGLEAVDEAIGRATEMGQPILFVPGIYGVGSIATIAAINIFSHVAKRAGELGTRVRVPTADAILMQVMQNVGEQAYLDIGRPDAFHADDVFFLTESQFAFAAAVDGIMVREKPAAVFLQGVFYAESLILAETGNSIGAIQIAGTDRDAQLPFFIAACDYTLIGEELFAASAYLSQSAQLLSTIRVQDIGKAALMIALVVGVALQLAGIDIIARVFSPALAM